ncbi:MAG: trypsin-like peptidase domain-containing protein [Deltaproteobacteria bacterium]|nr:trypsin-like peptidase domain-containing protein [Deltaproteobacteria bacterium]
MNRNLAVIYLVISVCLSSVIATGLGFYWGQSSHPTVVSQTVAPTSSVSVQTPTQVISVKQESAVVDVVQKVFPAVVSVIVTKDLPKYERYYSNPYNNPFFGGRTLYRQKGFERREVGGGTGFIVSSDGYILTNRHVVVDEEADYTVLFNDDQQYPAKVLARDVVNDIAVLKIEGHDFPVVEFGDSEAVQIGQAVIAIGNALGEFRNTVSTGVVSGLSRSITAGSSQSGGGESLSGLLQTDASINPGNSGGPLLNLAGQVIAINTAIVQNAQNIGFATPINPAKTVVESVKKYGRIVRPWLGVRYAAITEAVAQRFKLPTNNGAMIIGDPYTGAGAIAPNSPASRAGLKVQDVIVQVDDVTISKENPLAYVINNHAPGDKIILKIYRNGEFLNLEVGLEEMPEF